MAKSLPNVAESDATGETARLYCDIKDTLQVPAVNLVWRHLAMIGGALPWVWESVKPLFANSNLDVEAAGLRDIEGLPVIPSFPPAALRAVGVPAAEEPALRAVIANYDQSNPCNLLALMALISRLRDEESETVQSPLPARAAPTAVAIELPRLVPVEEMSADTK